MPVYSIGKPYTAAAVLLSFEIDAAIGDLVPDLPRALAPLTVRSLLSHRSGLDDYGTWSDYGPAVARREAPWPTRDVIDRAAVGVPGEFRYSNIGFLLLRLALERAHGGDLFSVLDDVVLSPLGIVARPFAVLADWRACDHPAVDDDLRAYDPAWVYTGTFLADPDEAARGLAAIVRGDLGEGIGDLMCETLPVDAPGHPMSPDAGYGLGLMTRGAPVTLVGHGGGGPGFGLFAAVSRDGSRWRGVVGVDDEDFGVTRAAIDAVLDAPSSGTA